MADSSLLAIRKKVRRLTRSLSPSQLSDAELDEYVNTFIQYDFPEHIRLFNLKRTLTWYTQPNIDIYDNTSGWSGLLNFDQTNLTIHPPIYIAGVQAFFTQSREQFFNSYTMISSIKSTKLTGDGVTTVFAGNIVPIPVLKNNVHFVSIIAGDTGVRLTDDGLGALTGDGVGTINYLTGAFTLNFLNPPAVGEPIMSETIPYSAAKPTSVLYYNNTFTLRPVPDQVYPINMEVEVRPTELLAVGTSPELQEWSQYISYGAAKKVFEDRMDMESVQMIMPEFKVQERLVLRRTLVQQSNERVATIYTENKGGLYGPFNGGLY